MTVTLSSRLEIPKDRFKEKNKFVVDGSTLSINSSILMMKRMLRNKVKTLRLVNEVIKLSVFKDLLSW